MPSIQCPGCKAHISVPGLINCPLCQTFMDPPFLREHNKAAPDLHARAIPTSAASAHIRTGTAAPVAPPKYKLTAKDWFTLITMSAIVILILLIAYRVVVPSESQLHDRKVSAALLACQQRIAGLADYGGAETPPYVKNYGKGDEFYFAWQRGSFHFKNGFNASVPMSASCTGTVSTGEIQHLSLNTKDVIGAP